MKAVSRLIVALIFSIFLLQSFTFPAEEKMNFRQSRWRKIKQEANANNKMIFVFVGADYCGACKKMDAIFENDRISSLFNQHFINARFNGNNFFHHDRAVNWGVTQVPSLVFLNSKGKVVHMAAGYRNVEALLNEAIMALGKEEKLPLHVECK